MIRPEVQIKYLLSIIEHVHSTIGNVDHTQGNGPNSAKARGIMLNNIRDAAYFAIRRHASDTQISRLEDGINELNESRNIPPDIMQSAETGMRQMIASMGAEMKKLETEIIEKANDAEF